MIILIFSPISPFIKIMTTCQKKTFNGYVKETSQGDCICAMFCLFNWTIIVLISETRRIYQRRLEKTGTGSFQCRGVSGTVDIFLTLLLVGIIIVPMILKWNFPLFIKLRLNINTIQQWFNIGLFIFSSPDSPVCSGSFEQ